MNSKLQIFAFMAFCLAIGSFIQASTNIPGGVLRGSYHWTISGSPYILLGSVSIPNAEPYTDSNHNGQYDIGEAYTEYDSNGVYNTRLSLAIDSGVEVRMSGIYVDGTVEASGVILNTAIYLNAGGIGNFGNCSFTGYVRYNSGSMGTILNSTIINHTNSRAVEIYDNDVTISGCSFDSCATAIMMTDCSPTVSSNTFRYNTWPLGYSGVCNPAYSGNTFTDNTHQAILLSGDIAVDWTPERLLPYFYTNSTSVLIGAKLTFSAGSEVRYWSAGIYVYGTVEASGVILSTDIYFNSGGIGNFSNCSITRHVRYSSGSTGGILNSTIINHTNSRAVDVYENDVTISGCSFDSCATALAISNCTPANISCNSFSNNTIGILFTGTATGSIYDCSFTNNMSYGIRNDNAGTVITASANWWGSTTGPNHSSNPAGTGDKISDNVQYAPWLNSIPGCTIPATPHSLILQNAIGLPIGNKAFVFHKITNNPPSLSEEFVGIWTTDSQGKVTLPLGSFSVGDLIKVSRKLFTRPAAKHTGILPNMYYIWLDNATFNTSSGAISYDTFSSVSNQDIILGHTLVTFDLLVSVEWDADDPYLDNLISGMRLLSNYMYDITNGDMCLGTVMVVDSMGYWNDADIRIWAENVKETGQFPDNTGNIRFGGGMFLKNSHLEFPRICYVNCFNGWRNLSYSLYPYDWTLAHVDFPCGQGYYSYSYPGCRILAHELCHAALGFRDEYEGYGGGTVFPDFNFGIMDAQLIDPSEMSSQIEYADPNHRVTEQWIDRGNRSCWDYFEWTFQDTYDDIFVKILKPLVIAMDGPNNNLANLNYDIGRLLVPQKINHGNPGLPAFTVEVTATCPWSPMLNNPVKATLYKNNRSWTIEQGRTDDNYRIRVLGVNCGDIIRTYWKYGLDLPFYGEAMICGQGTKAMGLTDDSLAIELHPIYLSGNLISRGYYISQDEYMYILTVNHSIAQPPIVELYPMNNLEQSYQLSPDQNGYSIAFTDSLGPFGALVINAIDDSGHVFSVKNDYSVITKPDSMPISKMASPDGYVNINIDSSNSFQKILIVESDFPVLRNGLDETMIPVGSAYTICSYPNTAELVELGNVVQIKYHPEFLGSASESNLAIYYWDYNFSQWALVGGIVDTILNTVIMPINHLGTFALFSPSVACGDANNDKNINIGDAVFLINYVFKSGTEPNPKCAGNANGDSSVNVGDAVYLINHVFKGGPAPNPNCCP